MLHFDAGKYALYLWPAYGLSALVLIALVADSLARARRWRRAAEKGRDKLSQQPPSAP